MASPSPNTLGLNFHQLETKELPSTTLQQEEFIEIPNHSSPGESPRSFPELEEDHTEVKDKKKAYVNPERVKTGGNQRDKLSEEELVERMARMREQNEKIKQRRMDVQADEAAFRKTQESERAKLAQIRKVQESVDRTREQNAKRKMDKIKSREWDSGKPTGDWKRQGEKPEYVHNATAGAVEKGSPPPEPIPTPREVGGRIQSSGRGSSHRNMGRVKVRSSSDATHGGAARFAMNSTSTVPRDKIGSSQQASS